MSTGFVPRCMDDAPREVVEAARIIAKAIRTATVESVREVYPSLDESDPAWRDLLRGIFLMAANQEAKQL